MHRETVRSELPVEQAEQEWFPAKDHTILWISRRLQSNQRWRSTFGSADMKVLHADELNLSLERVDEADIDIILVETSGVTHDDIDLCRRLRQLFDTPLMLIAANVNTGC